MELTNHSLFDASNVHTVFMAEGNIYKLPTRVDSGGATKIPENSDSGVDLSGSKISSKRLIICKAAMLMSTIAVVVLISTTFVKMTNMEKTGKIIEAAEDQGWYAPGNGYQYKLTEDPSSWDKSRYLCKNLGGDLAVNGMKDREIGLNISIALPLHRSWVGMRKSLRDRRWLWLDGSIDLPILYQNATKDGKVVNYLARRPCSSLM